MASTYARRDAPTESSVAAKVVALMLGILVAVLGFFALLMWADAREARDGAVTAADHGDPNVALPLSSFAGQVGANATELAEAHTAYDARMPPVPAGDVVKVHMTPEGHGRGDRSWFATTPGPSTGTALRVRSCTCERVRPSR